MSAAIGGRLPLTNLAQNGVATYLHSAGIEAGYGFFAPNVPDNYQLLFEIHYPDGRTEYDVPIVRSDAAGMRLAGLLDQAAETDLEPLRKVIVKILAFSSWQNHPEATSIRALLALAVLPTPQQFEDKKKESHEILDAYEFSFRKNQSKDKAE